LNLKLFFNYIKLEIKSITWKAGEAQTAVIHFFGLFVYLVIVHSV